MKLLCRSNLSWEARREMFERQPPVKRKPKRGQRRRLRVSATDKVRIALASGPLSFKVLKDRTRLDEDVLDVALATMMIQTREVVRDGKRFGLLESKQVRQRARVYSMVGER